MKKTKTVRGKKIGRSTVERLLAQVEHGNWLDACEAAKVLEHVKGEYPIRELTRILRTGRRIYTREAAGYALAWNDDRKAVEGLLASATDLDEKDRVRAQAIEGLAIHMWCVPARSPIRRQVEALMLGMLDSPSPTVRFWACYGLGSLHSRRAIPRLRKIAKHDTHVCPGWWYVREEAEDALECLAGRWSQDRVPVRFRKKANAGPVAS